MQINPKLAQKLVTEKEMDKFRENDISGKELDKKQKN